MAQMGRFEPDNPAFGMPDEMLASGKYTEIHVNRDVQAVFPGYRGGGRPDLIGVRTDGRLDIIEIAHPTQTTDDLLKQVGRYWDKIPTAKQGDIILVNPTMVNNQLRLDMTFFPVAGRNGANLPIPFPR
jgi:hypothetical protein